MLDLLVDSLSVHDSSRTLTDIEPNLNARTIARYANPCFVYFRACTIDDYHAIGPVMQRHCRAHHDRWMEIRQVGDRIENYTVANNQSEWNLSASLVEHNNRDLIWILCTRNPFARAWFGAGCAERQGQRDSESSRAQGFVSERIWRPVWLTPALSRRAEGGRLQRLVARRSWKARASDATSTTTPRRRLSRAPPRRASPSSSWLPSQPLPSRGPYHRSAR